MSGCIENLYDYDSVKKYSKCGIVSLKTNFHRNKKMGDGLNKQCKFCVNQRQRQYDIEYRGKKENNIMKIMTKFKNIVVIIKIKGIKIFEKKENQI